jgi:predicted exporter
MSRRGLAATLIWALSAALGLTIAARAHYTADLSAFLPRRASATQELLVEQLREGPAAHLIIAAISGGDAATRAEVSRRMAARVRSDAAFVAIENGDESQLQRDRDFLFEHRYLLSPRVTPQLFTASGLHAAIGEALDVLASSAGPLVKPLFVRDPTLETLAILESLDEGHAPRVASGVWSSPDGARAVMLAHTRASGADIDGQQAACTALERSFVAAIAGVPQQPGAALTLSISGPPVFAVNSRAIIKHQVWRLSALSAAGIAALLLLVYRSLPVLALTLVPVASGALAGVAAVALGFSAVHGITLGFGVTLIGESVDYAIYLFIQRAGDFRRAVWPTLRLGVLTSICGFAALLPSAFPGLSQLGLYSIAGLLAAALVTRFVLPEWLPRQPAIRDLTGAGAYLEQLSRRLHAARGVLLIVACVAGAALYLHRGTIWSRELAALSPIRAADFELDERLRADAGAPDVGYLVVASARDRESALSAAEAVGARLTPLVESGVIGGFQSPARFLPSIAAQETRRASLPPASLLRAHLDDALEGLPLSAARLEPFVSDVERARSAGPLSQADLAGTSLGSLVGALLVRTPSGWSALLPMAARGSADLSPRALAEIRAAVERSGVRAELLDLKGEADRLYSRYLSDALRLAFGGLIAIVVLLSVSLRSLRRMMRVVAPLALSVLVVAAGLVALGHALTILHLVGMLLIVAVGSNYALFFDRAATHPQEGSVPLTLASLLVANLATVLAFGVLASSSVPVLADLGSTVAPGTFLALLFAAVLAQPGALAPVEAARA